MVTQSWFHSINFAGCGMAGRTFQVTFLLRCLRIFQLSRDLILRPLFTHCDMRGRTAQPLTPHRLCCATRRGFPRPYNFKLILRQIKALLPRHACLALFLPPADYRQHSPNLSMHLNHRKNFALHFPHLVPLTPQVKQCQPFLGSYLVWDFKLVLLEFTFGYAGSFMFFLTTSVHSLACCVCFKPLPGTQTLPPKRAWVSIWQV